MFGLVFVIELLGKCIAFGVFRGPTAYLRLSKGWNIADAVIILLSLITVFVPPLRAFRAVRVFRVFRALSRFESSKVATRAFLSTLPAAGNVGFVVGIVWIIFAVLGVNLYKGTFWRCTDPAVDTMSQCSGYFIDTTGMNSTREWYNLPYNFDHIGSCHGQKQKQFFFCFVFFISPSRRDGFVKRRSANITVGNALLSLFQVSTREGGVQVMWAAVDSRGVSLNPKRDSSPAAAVYFIAFLLFGCNYALNLLAGTVVDSFNRKKKRYEGFAFLSTKQKQWLATQKILLALRPPRPIKAPKKTNRLAFYYVVQSVWFKALITLVIVANLVALSVRHYNMPKALESAIDIANHVFLAVRLVLLGLAVLRCKTRNTHEKTKNSSVDFLLFLNNNVLDLYVGGCVEPHWTWTVPVLWPAIGV